MAAENCDNPLMDFSRAGRFNEAAAHGRGKPRSPGSASSQSRCFNEAAAHGRGKRPGYRAAVISVSAALQ